MKQISADFKFEHTYPSRFSNVYKNVTRTVYGSVTFKNNKLSIKIQDRNYLSGVSMIEDKIRSEFKDYNNSSIFYNILETSESLVDELRIATQDLKNDYIQKTKESAKRMYDSAVENYPIIKEKKEIAWKEYISDKNSWGNSYAYKNISKELEKLKQIVDLSFEKFLLSELNYAELHYESSLIKLAERLVAKGISKNYKISSGYVGINFEVVITHELGTVKAWTIIAEGEIIRAHYRYLVK